MKTCDLILLLVQDGPVRVSLDQALVHATIAATLIAGVAFFELTTVSSSKWETHMVGHNARLFLTIIPSLSAAPLARLPYAMRQGAPCVRLSRERLPGGCSWHCRGVPCSKAPC